jgi:glycosyltransferase involved in cell wall biosynthesis
MMASDQDLKSKSIDIVCTIYNDEETLNLLVDAIAEHVEPIGLPWRLILVCDGSPDDSWVEMEKAAAERDNLLIIELSRNFGQHIAVAAGLDQAAADYVIVMDSDLQDPPAAIPEIIEKLQNEDLDIVFVERLRRHDTAFKKFTSWLFWKFIRLVSGKNIRANTMMLRGMSRRAVEALKSMREHHRFLGGLSAWIGFSQGSIEYEAGQRLRGASNYNLPRLARFALDATTSSSMGPLRLASVLGFLATGFAFFYGALIVVKHVFFEVQLPGFSTLVVLITGLSGLQLLILGIMGEYLGRSLRESQRRPLYFIRQAKGAVDQDAIKKMPLPPARGA